MTDIPILPIIQSGKILNFQPLFHEDLKFKINNNRLIILGGNGMGKTTILQAIIYCIAGEYTKDYEDETTKRWDKKFFYGRIDNPTEAFVEIEFKIGDDLVKIKRGFDRKSILAFTLNGSLISDNSNKAEGNFESYLKEEHGYNEISDFYFIIHKLCYLPESRPNLVWDIDAQVRLLMLLSGDLIDEKDFREKRSQLKFLDTKIRHTNVDINKLKNAIEEDESPSENDTKNEENDLGNSGILLEEYDQLLEKRKALSKEYNLLNEKYIETSSELEDAQTSLKRAEEDFILKNIKELESEEASLAVYKLLHRKICPVCGDFSEELFKSAKNNIDNDQCPICGEHQDIEGDLDLDSISIKVNELLSKKLSYEKKLKNLSDSINDIKSRELSIQTKLNQYRLKKPRLNIVGDVSESDVKELRDKLIKEQENKSTLKLMFNDLSQEIEDLYSQFRNQIQTRINKLAKIFTDYATEFLGIKCELHSIKADAKFVDLQLFVPKFDKKIRTGPNECSEAQRFFLDIAFRMALIDFANTLNNHKGSFICETPENALDMAYLDNVARMFRRFSERGHHFIATSNIQKGGLAGYMLSDLSREDRRQSILNMIDKARLTKVQQDSLEKLQEQLDLILQA